MSKRESNVIIEIRSAPYDVWEFHEDCDSIEQAYDRLDELEEEAILKGWPSDINNYRVAAKTEDTVYNVYS